MLDAKNGFWPVSLDEASSYAITFGTPCGRCRWLRMQFGIALAPEEFQRRIDQDFVGLNGCNTIADDILVWMWRDMGRSIGRSRFQCSKYSGSVPRESNKVEWRQSTIQV